MMGSGYDYDVNDDNHNAYDDTKQQQSLPYWVEASNNIYQVTWLLYIQSYPYILIFKKLFPTNIVIIMWVILDS